VIFLSRASKCAISCDLRYWPINVILIESKPCWKNWEMVKTILTANSTNNYMSSRPLLLDVFVTYVFPVKQSQKLTFNIYGIFICWYHKTCIRIAISVSIYPNERPHWIHRNNSALQHVVLTWYIKVVRNGILNS
jgi:hypothetical protein